MARRAGRAARRARPVPGLVKGRTRARPRAGGSAGAAKRVASARQRLVGERPLAELVTEPPCRDVDRVQDHGRRDLHVEIPGAAGGEEAVLHRVHEVREQHEVEHLRLPLERVELSKRGLHPVGRH